MDVESILGCEIRVRSSRKDFSAGRDWVAPGLQGDVAASLGKICNQASAQHEDPAATSRWWHRAS